MSTKPRLLYLIRHGATEANTRRPYVLQGCRSDLPLSDIGRRQAEAASRTLMDRKFARIFSSPLRRALQTAEILAQPHGLPVQIADGLIECDVGNWEGLTWEQVRQLDEPYFASFETDPGRVPYAGGESFQQVQDRTVPAVQQLIRENPDGDLVAVTHNFVARVYIAHLTGIPIAKARTLRQDNAGITIISITGQNEKLLTLNSVLHLDGLLFD